MNESYFTPYSEMSVVSNAGSRMLTIIERTCRSVIVWLGCSHYEVLVQFYVSFFQAVSSTSRRYIHDVCATGNCMNYFIVCFEFVR